MHIGWPQLIYLALNLFGLGNIVAKGSVETKASHAVPVWIFIVLPLLWWGGFFGG